MNILKPAAATQARVRAPKATPQTETAAAVLTGAPPTPFESSSIGSVPARIAATASTAVAEVADKYASANLVPGELIVKMEGAAKTELMSDFASEYGAKVIEKFDLPESVFKSIGGDMLRLKLPVGISPFEAIAAMKDDDRVAYAEPNEVITLEEFETNSQAPPTKSDSQEPNDLNSKLWGLNNDGQTGGTPGADVSAKEAWSINTGDGSANGPLIAVIDTGIDYNHPDLKANMWTNPGEIPGDGIDNDNNGVVDDIHGYYPGANSGDPMDGHSHGTHCAGTIAAVGNNGEGVTGVMQNARLMAVKIFSDEGSTTTADIVKAINYTNKMGADITSNSWGGGARSEAIRDAFASNDALHVIAAGNSNFDNDIRENYPSNYNLENIIAVAATNHNDERASFSQWGAKKVDVAAPGRNIWSTVPISKGSYGSKSGTSMATPHVSGGAGLLKSQYPDASNAEIKARLIHGSDKIDALKDISVSDGRVNFAASLEDDKVAPGSPNDFKASSVTSRGAQLSWTTVGDDKWDNGAAQGIELLLSKDPVTADNADKATLISVAGSGEVGDLASYQHKIVPSEADQTIHFGMRAVDNVGNLSEMRTTSITIPGADVALKESFDGDEISFQAAGGFARIEVDGKGKVFTTSSKSSKPESTLTSGAIDLTEKTGAYLKFENQTFISWRDRATVEVTKDGGESWETVQKLPRRQPWSATQVDLSSFDGEKIQLRFHVKSQDGKSTGGLSVDNVLLLTNKA